MKSFPQLLGTMGRNPVYALNKKRAQADIYVVQRVVMNFTRMVLMLVKMGLVVMIAIQEKEINDAKLRQSQIRSMVGG